MFSYIIIDMLLVLQVFYPLQVDEVRGTIIIKDPNAQTGDPPKTFTFDTVFSPECKQVDVYNQVARPIVESVLEGYNGKVDRYEATLTHLIYLKNF